MEAFETEWTYPNNFNDSELVTGTELQTMNFQPQPKSLQTKIGQQDGYRAPYQKSTFCFSINILIIFKMILTFESL